MNEVIERRKIDSKTYHLGGRKFRLSKRLTPMHYLKDGALTDIDLSSRLDRGDELIDKAPYSLRVRGLAYRYTSSTGEVSVELKEVGGVPITVVPTATKTKHYFVYEDIALDTNYLIVPKSFGCATVLQLRSAAAPRSWSWEILGEASLINPIVGRDAMGRHCEIVVERTGSILTATWSGRVTSQRALRDTPEDPWTSDIVYPVKIDPTVNEEIGPTADDVFSRATTGGTPFNTTQTDVGVGLNTDYTWTNTWGGFRFQTIGIPQGATIDTAVLIGKLNSVNGTADIRIYADDVVDAPAFAAGTGPGDSNRVKNITKTTAFLGFTATGVGYSTWDVKTVVQEIINLPGWVSDNDIRFGFFNQLETGNNRIGIAAVGAVENVMQFDIDFTEAAGGAPPIWRRPMRAFRQPF